MAAELITAYHILHKHKVINEYGSVSIRNPHNPTTFMIGRRSALLTSSLDDLVERSVADGSIHQRPTQTELTSQNTLNTEHFLHSCMYARYPEIRSVIHAQSTLGIVYGLCDASGSMLLPVYNRAGFVGDYTPIFDPARHYSLLPNSWPRDLTISHPVLGDAVARLLVGAGVNGERTLPDYGCVMLRGNGVALWGDDIKHAVYKAVQLQRSTEIQAAAMLQRAHSELGITYLTDIEVKDCEDLVRQSIAAHWDAWEVEVDRDSVYRNAFH